MYLPHFLKFLNLTILSHICAVFYVSFPKIFVYTEYSMPPKKEISLLPSEENLNSPLAKITKWATSTGRVVIIFVELIVILAFLSRFSLDRRNADLSETLRQQKAILASTKDFENDYLSLQKRLSYIREFYNNEPQYVSFIDSLISTVPNDIYFQMFTFKKNPDNKQLYCQAQLYSYQEQSLIDFITNAGLNPDIEYVNVQKIEKKTKDNKYYLDVTIFFKKN